MTVFIKCLVICQKTSDCSGEISGCDFKVIPSFSELILQFETEPHVLLKKYISMYVMEKSMGWGSNPNLKTFISKPECVL